MRAPFCLLALTSFCFVACSGAAPQTTVGQARSSLSRDTSPSVSAADQQAFEQGNASFAFSMYGTLRAADPSSNLFFSPYSMSSALARTYAGAGGQTAAEIAKAMGFTLPPERLHPAFDWVDLQLASRAGPTGPGTGESGTPFSLHVSNSLWGDRRLTFQQPFLDTLAVDYGSGVEVVDFAGAPDPSRQAINQWVSDQTVGKVPQLLPSGSIKPETLFVLVNAIYFQAGWASTFDASGTSPQTFTRADGTTEQVPTMMQTSTFAYAEAPGWQAVELPYIGGQVAMEVVLPAEGAGAGFDAALTSAQFASMVGGMTPQDVRLSLPKVQVAGASFSIKTALQALGMQTAFTPAADFTPMTPGGAEISDAFHQSFLSVDETGTEAAAATAVVGADATVALPPPHIVDMAVSRPFFLAIRDVPTGTILFAGKIQEPAAGATGGTGSTGNGATGQ
jgi:serpin B